MDAHHQPSEENPHLGPALTAVILSIAVLVTFGFYARSVEHRWIKALAADQAMVKRDGKLAPVNQGAALRARRSRPASYCPSMAAPSWS